MKLGINGDCCCQRWTQTCLLLREVTVNKLFQRSFFVCIFFLCLHLFKITTRGWRRQLIIKVQGKRLQTCSLKRIATWLSTLVRFPYSWLSQRSIKPTSNWATRTGIVDSLVDLTSTANASRSVLDSSQQTPIRHYSSLNTYTPLRVKIRKSLPSVPKEEKSRS